MPKVVDHEHMRLSVAEATTKIIARSGFNGLTMRTIAKESGISYGALFHYFENKEAVLLETVAFLTQRQHERINSEMAKVNTSPLARLERLLEVDTKVDAESFDSSVVWQAFTCLSIHEPQFAEQHRTITNVILDQSILLLEEAKAAGEIPANVNVEHEAAVLSLLCAGIHNQALLRPNQLTPDMQISLIRSQVKKIIGSDSRQPMPGDETVLSS